MRIASSYYASTNKVLAGLAERIEADLRTRHYAGGPSFLGKAHPSTDFLKHHMREAFERSNQHRHSAWVLIALLILANGVSPSLEVHAKEQKSAAEPRTFASPGVAILTLTAAAKEGDHSALREIFGPGDKELVTGDKVDDEVNFAEFSKEIMQKCKPIRRGDGKITLNIGSENRPFPIPLVKKDGRWFFDTDAGKEQIIKRHIREDELKTIGVCRTYVDAQHKYVRRDRDGSEVLKYAQKLTSTGGRHDGLYWQAAGNGKISPFGPLVAEARSEGYSPVKNDEVPHPFHGYLFKILSGQGPAARGGSYNYIVDSNMIGGFAMVAYPSKWGHSGTMTFIINQRDELYERNLGSKSGEIAAAMSEYNPDRNWALAPAQKEADR